MCFDGLVGPSIKTSSLQGFTMAAIWPDRSTVCMRNKKEREPSDSKTTAFVLDTFIDIWHSGFWGPCIATNECSVRRTPSLATKVSRD